MIKLLYLASPLVSLTLAVKGYPAAYILAGIAISMALLFLDSLAIAARMLGSLGARSAFRFVARMVPALAVTLIPAAGWNGAAFLLGLGLARLVP